VMIDLGRGRAAWRRPGRPRNSEEIERVPEAASPGLHRGGYRSKCGPTEIAEWGGDHARWEREKNNLKHST